MKFVLFVMIGLVFVAGAFSVVQITAQNDLILRVTIEKNTTELINPAHEARVIQNGTVQRSDIIFYTN